MDLKDRLIRVDATSATALREIAKGVLDPAALAEACHDPNCSDAASWIVKALLEQGRAEDLDLVRCLAALEHAINWPTQLHLLQCVQFVPEAALGVTGPVINLASAKRTLVRVWALDALVRIADLRPEWRPEAAEHLAKADAGPASLRARVRRLETLWRAWDPDENPKEYP